VSNQRPTPQPQVTTRMAAAVPAESFNAAVKVERVHRTVYPTRKRAADDIAQYIELRYNRARLHSGLGYRTPQEVHDEYLNQQLAA
jgi:putative transposase